MEGATSTAIVIADNANPERAVVSSPRPLPSPPNMYVVQFPKDQVYRVPTRENAEFMERHRNLPQNTATKKRRRTCHCAFPRVWITAALILVAIIAVIGIIIAACYFIFNPTGPTFAITRVVVKNGPTKHAPPKYEISLKAKNTNGRMGMVYESSEVSLLVDENGKKIAAGKFPRTEQGKGGSTAVKVLLTRTGGGPGLGDDSVDLALEMRLRVRVSTGGVESWVMTANVACGFEVSGLGESGGTKILSQHCDTNFRLY